MTTTTQVTTPPFLRPAEAAYLLGVNLKTVLKGIHDGAVPCVKIGRAFLVPKQWVADEARIEPEAIDHMLAGRPAR